MLRHTINMLITVQNQIGFKEQNKTCEMITRSATTGYSWHSLLKFPAILGGKSTVTLVKMFDNCDPMRSHSHCPVDTALDVYASMCVCCTPWTVCVFYSTDHACCTPLTVCVLYITNHVCCKSLTVCVFYITDHAVACMLYTIDCMCIVHH